MYSGDGDKVTPRGLVPSRHGDEILGQLRALGASLDWSRCAFTMDPVSPASPSATPPSVPKCPQASPTVPSGLLAGGN